MKIKDIYTSLPKNINLQDIHPNKGIKADIFCQNKNTSEISNSYPHTINAHGNSNIRIKSLRNQNNSSDSLHKANKNTLSIVKKSINSIATNLSKKGSIDIEKSSTIKEHLNERVNLIFKKLFIYKSFKVIAFALLIILLGFFNKIGIEYFTNSGYKNLLSLSSKYSGTEKLKNNYSYQEKISSAKNNFFIANLLFTPFKFFTNQSAKNAFLTIKGGKEISDFLDTIIVILDEINTLINQKGTENIMFSQLLLNNKKVFLNFEKTIESIEKTYANINLENSHPDLQIKLDAFKIKLKQAKYYIYTINNNFDTFLELFGHTKRKKYLVVFQNNDEIRPQGGFMGSLGIVEVFRGQVKDFTKNDVYFYEFKIKKENFNSIPAPEGIHKLTQNLGLRDSNYYINSKDSGEKLKFFMQKAGHNIDGIIYLNQNTLFKVLDLVGEFDSKVLGQKINSKNFSLIMSLLVESKVSKEGTLGTPKKILFDFMEEFQEQLKAKKTSLSQIGNILFNDIKKREISIYSFDKKERTLLQGLSLFNPINYGETLDFSYPVFTSISGNKSDRYIDFSYKKDVSKKNIDCSYETSLEIQLTHKFNNEEKNKITELGKKYKINTDDKKYFDNLLFIQGNGDNKQFVRVILPKNAQIKNKNVSITPYYERGKSVSFYMNTQVGDSSTFKLNYTIPNSKCKVYNYKFYKQPGVRQFNLEINNFGEKYSFNTSKKDIYFNQ